MEIFKADDAAALLTAHFLTRTMVEPAMPAPGSRAEAYAAQDRMISALGGACGWKVGRARPGDEPYCAPIPASRRFDDDSDYARYHGVARVEAEIGFRLGRDVPPSGDDRDKDACAELVDALVPALEIVETRLAGAGAQNPLWKLADLQANGALVTGKPVPWRGQDLGRTRLVVGSSGQDIFDEVPHPFGEPFDLFCWTVNHVSRQRGGLKRGQVIITGSYCGIVDVSSPQRFVAAFADYGSVSVQVR